LSKLEGRDEPTKEAVGNLVEGGGKKGQRSGIPRRQVSITSQAG